MLLHETSLLYRRALKLLIRHASLDVGRGAESWILRGDLDLAEVLDLLRDVSSATARRAGGARIAFLSLDDRKPPAVARALRRVRRLLRLKATTELLIHATEGVVAGDSAFHEEAVALAAADLVAAHRERFERVDLAPALVPAAHAGTLLAILGQPDRVLLDPEQEVRLVEPMAEDTHGSFVYPAAAMATSPLRPVTVLVEAADRLFRRVVTVNDVVAADLSTEAAEAFGLPEDERVFKRFFPRIHWTDDACMRLCCVLASSIKDFSAARTPLRMATFAPLEAGA